MKISIVIPNLNSGEYLERCLDSIYKQSYKDFEVVLIDGYSRDESMQAIEKYYTKKKLIIGYRRPQGQSDAINAGMSIATGDVVTYICADDVYEPECFRRVIKCFTENPNTQWLHGRGSIIDSKGREIRIPVTTFKEMFQLNYTYNALKCIDFIVQPTVFIRKSFFKQIGEFNTKLKYCMDYDYFLRAGQISKPKFINRYLADWRAHSSSLSVMEYKAEAREAFQVQKQYSGWQFRPLQWLVYGITIALYSSLR